MSRIPAAGLQENYGLLLANLLMARTIARVLPGHAAGNADELLIWFGYAPSLALRSPGLGISPLLIR